MKPRAKFPVGVGTFLLVWSVLGAASVLWGYREIMASCPAFDDFSGCFEPPYRLSALVFLFVWAALEIPLLIVWLTGRRWKR